MRWQRADEIEAHAWRDCFAAAPATLGCAAQQVPGTDAQLLICRSLPALMFNRVIGINHDASLAPATMDWIRRSYRDAGVDSFWMHAWAAGEPPAGQPAWIKFLYDFEQPLQATRQDSLLHVRLAQPGEAALVAGIMHRGFGLPEPITQWLGSMAGRAGWQIYFACTPDGLPVAAGALFIENGAAWLGMGCTVPDARAQGAQTLLLSARLAEARRAGCTVAAVEAGMPRDGENNPSLNNILRAGFLPVGPRVNIETKSK
jgi:GNAT superfamily N-acetyltransferase